MFEIGDEVRFLVNCRISGRNEGYITYSGASGAYINIPKDTRCIVLGSRVSSRVTNLSVVLLDTSHLDLYKDLKINKVESFDHQIEHIPALVLLAEAAN